MLQQEDEEQILTLEWNVRNHFWNPALGDGNGAGLGPFDTAWQRASMFWNQAIDDHLNGHYGNAYQKLGRVCHLVQDMAVPAHTLVDPHLSIEFLRVQPDPDSLHFFAASYLVHWDLNDSAPMAAEDSLYAVMKSLAFYSQRWDSDDYWGTGPIGNSQRGQCVGLISLNTGIGLGSLNGNRLPCCQDGFIYNCDLQRIVTNTMPQGEKATTKVLRLFFDAVRPTVQIEAPIPGKIYSVLKGIPLRARALNGQIDHVEFQFALTPNPTEQNWTSLGNGTQSSADSSVFTAIWFAPTIDAAAVSVRAIAYDGTGCGSLPSVVQTSVDSTRPIVRHTRP